MQAQEKAKAQAKAKAKEKELDDEYDKEQRKEKLNNLFADYPDIATYSSAGDESLVFPPVSDGRKELEEWMMVDTRIHHNCKTCSTELEYRSACPQKDVIYWNHQNPGDPADRKKDFYCEDCFGALLTLSGDGDDVLLEDVDMPPLASHLDDENENPVPPPMIPVEDPTLGADPMEDVDMPPLGSHLDDENGADPMPHMEDVSEDEDEGEDGSKYDWRNGLVIPSHEVLAEQIVGPGHTPGDRPSVHQLREEFLKTSDIMDLRVLRNRALTVDLSVHKTNKNSKKITSKVFFYPRGSKIAKSKCNYIRFARRRSGFWTLSTSDTVPQLLVRWQKDHPATAALQRERKMSYTKEAVRTAINMLGTNRQQATYKQIAERLNDPNSAHAYKCNENERDYNSHDIRRLIKLLFPPVQGVRVCVCVCVWGGADALTMLLWCVCAGVGRATDDCPSQ